MSELEKISKKIKPVAQKYNLTYVWLFGSYAKKKQRKDSDVDIIVRTEDVIGGFKIVELKFALEEALKKQVDIASVDYKKINKDLIKIFQKSNTFEKNN